MGIPEVAGEAGSAKDAGKPQARVSAVPGSRAAAEAEAEEMLAASGFCEAGGNGSEPVVGAGFRA